MKKEKKEEGEERVISAQVMAENNYQARPEHP